MQSFYDASKWSFDHGRSSTKRTENHKNGYRDAKPNRAKRDGADYISGAHPMASI